MKSIHSNLQYLFLKVYNNETIDTYNNVTRKKRGKRVFDFIVELSNDDLLRRVFLRLAEHVSSEQLMFLQNEINSSVCLRKMFRK